MSISFVPCAMCLAIATLFGCSTPPNEPQGRPLTELEGRTTMGTTIAAGAAAAASVAEYRHTLNNSKFKIGAAPTTRNDNGLLRAVGSFGVFATNPINGSVGGVLNADAPLGTFSMTEPVHRERVRAYFLRAGIPVEQVGGVHSTVSSGGGGLSGVPATSSQSMPVTYSSILERTIQGISVLESVAWARMNDDGDVVAEEVFWPALPVSVVNEAVAMDISMRDAGQRAAYLGKLPTDVAAAANGRVVIRHSSLVERGTFVAVACYDAPGQNGYRRHFGVDGHELRLPHEMRDVTGASSK